MLVLAKSVLAMMIGFIIAIIFGYILIPLLKKFKIGQNVSEYLSEQHKSKQGVPTMGGLIFIIPTLLTIFVLLLLKKMEFTENLFIVLFVFLGYALVGFLDDYLIIKRHNNKGLTQLQKLFLQLVIALIFFYIFINSGNDPVLLIYTLGIEIDMGWFYGLFILFVLLASSNAVNLTDGLDGLAGGLSLIAFVTFGLIAWNSRGIYGYQDLAIFCFILVGTLLAFLFYNTHPAKVFMGNTGSLALGATLASLAIITNHEITFVVVAGVFVVETLTCIIQTLSVIFRKKRVFLMTPLHHHFEKLGWQEQDIVKMFWVVGLILGMISIVFGVWI
ncbi:MAG: phospho-N-acetylmuramoyl-pentapeptide-transferase [Erysipelotrichaceae bacterium]|nr:phospho-N-acetylmuramoyl-pentapeptide-transferase [Erysipelotrichaceae bacterium]